MKINEVTRKPLNIYLRGFRAPQAPVTVPTHGVTVKEIQTKINKAESTLRGQLNELIKANIIVRCTQKGYWPLVEKIANP